MSLFPAISDSNLLTVATVDWSSFACVNIENAEIWKKKCLDVKVGGKFDKNMTKKSQKGS